MQTGDDLADDTDSTALLVRIPACDFLLDDKGRDIAALIRQIESDEAMPYILPK